MNQTNQINQPVWINRSCQWVRSENLSGEFEERHLDFGCERRRLTEGRRFGRTDLRSGGGSDPQRQVWYQLRRKRGFWAGWRRTWGCKALRIWGRRWIWTKIHGEQRRSTERGGTNLRWAMRVQWFAGDKVWEWYSWIFSLFPLQSYQALISDGDFILYARLGVTRIAS